MAGRISCANHRRLRFLTPHFHFLAQNPPAQDRAIHAYPFIREQLLSFSNHRNKMYTGCRVCYCIAKTNFGGQASLARSVGYELLGEEKVQLYPMSILESRVVPKTKSRGPFRSYGLSSFRGLQITSDRPQLEEGWLHCEKLLKIYLTMATHDTPVIRASEYRW